MRADNACFAKLPPIAADDKGEAAGSWSLSAQMSDFLRRPTTLLLQPINMWRIWCVLRDLMHITKCCTPTNGVTTVGHALTACVPRSGSCRLSLHTSDYYPAQRS